MQLFRDRSRDEHGLFATVRFWFDLLLDLCTSLPREYRNLLRSPVAAPFRQRLTSAPFFDVLEVGSPRPSAFFVAGICSLLMTAAVWAMVNHDASRHLWSPRGSTRHHRNRNSSRPRHPLQPRKTPTLQSQTSGRRCLRLHHRFPQPTPQTSASAPPPRSSDGATLDAAEKQHVIQQAVADLEQYYFDRNVAHETADALLAHEKNGDDNAATQGPAFAELLRTQMRDASHDMHLVVEYSQNPLPSGPPPQTAASQELYGQAMLQRNCMLHQVEVLPNRIGYLKLDFFPDTSVCGATAKAAMAKLNDADAIIFDLRDNTGGFPDMVSLLASYLFDHPVYMYSPRGAPTTDSWTHSPVPGNKLADKPVYILTSRTTWSGAEQLRATT